MVTLCISLIALVLGYLLYGRFVDSVFGPDDRETPAVAMADGVDHIVLPNWKVFMIQFLNIAGTGPLFGASLALLIWQVEDANGFNTIWQYAGWSNQALAVFMLWAITVYLVRQKKNYWIALIPALFMTCVCSTFLFISKLTFHLPEVIAYVAGGACMVIAIFWFYVWYYRNKKSTK